MEPVVGVCGEVARNERGQFDQVAVWRRRLAA